MLLRSNNLTSYFWMMMALGALSPAANAGMILTAEVYDTPGLPGFQTYDVTASSLEGFVNGFDFFGSVSENAGPRYGITGPLYQGGGEDIYAAYQKNRLFVGGTKELADTRWLVDNSTGLQIGASQSTEALHTAFTFRGTSTQRDSLRNLPFVRLVTNDPSAVRLNGEFVVNQFWSDGTSVGRDLFSVDTLLSDISVVSAPKINTFPDVPAEVITERERVVAEEAARQLQREQALFKKAELERSRLEREALQAREAAEAARLAVERTEQLATALIQIRKKAIEATRLEQERLAAEVSKTVDEPIEVLIEQENPVETSLIYVVGGTIDISEWLIPRYEGNILTTDWLRGGLIDSIAIIDVVAIDTINLFHSDFILTLDVNSDRLVAPIALITGLQLETNAAVPEPSAILLLGVIALFRWSHRSGAEIRHGVFHR